VPDKLIVFIRKPVATQKCTDADFYATIKSITITWNNQSGLLASMTPEQLYRNSIQSGLTDLTWDQFSGSVMSIGAFSGEPNGAASSIRNLYSGVGANLLANPNPGVQLVPTTGTILVLNFAEVIQLNEDFYAPGSLGSFNLQLRVSAQNNSNVNWAANTAELIIMPMNCGVFVNEKGTSSTFTALLSKQDVLDVQGQQA